MKNKYCVFVFISGFCFLLSCTSNRKTIQQPELSEDSIKTLILSKEKATLDRWYNGDPMGFIDNSWNDVTYFDPSLMNRVDSIDNFRKLLTPIIGLVHISSHKLEKPLIQVYGDIAVLTFTDVFNVGESTIRWHATEIYQQRKNDWKLIHSHWTESKIK